MHIFGDNLQVTPSIFHAVQNSWFAVDSSTFYVISQHFHLEYVSSVSKLEFQYVSLICWSSEFLWLPVLWRTSTSSPGWHNLLLHHNPVDYQFIWSFMACHHKILFTSFLLILSCISLSSMVLFFLVGANVFAIDARVIVELRI